MVKIMLEPQCLDCKHLDVHDGTNGYWNELSGDAEFVSGEITCSHIQTCKHMGKMPNVSGIVGEFMSRRGGE